MLHEKIKFGTPLNTPFYQDLKAKVDEYFKGKKTRKANGLMIFKMVLIGILFFGSYFSLLNNGFDRINMLLLTIVFGFSHVLIAFNISHDASHGALFKKPRLNYLFSYTFNLIGVNRYIWDIKHNQSHHSFTNVPRYDIDIEQIKIARLVPHMPLKWFYRYQHVYIPLLYPFTSLFMIFIKDFQMFSTHQYGNNFHPAHTKKEYRILFMSKLFYFNYMLTLPMIFINLVWWKILLGFFIMHLIIGTFLAIILFPVHALDDSPFPEPDENGIIDNSWAVHQVQTSTNFGPNSRLLHQLSGGLNTHIAHHIFPAVCHIHYYALTKIIRDVAERHHITYRDNSTFQALNSHINLLKIMGRQPYVNSQELYHSPAMS